MTDARVGSRAVELRTTDGRVPGRRGRATRRRLLDITHDALAEVPYRDLTVAEIARRAGTSPATFYQYFRDIESAVLVLAAALVDEGADRLRSLAEEARRDDGAGAHDLAAGVLELFERERALLGVVDRAALEGDERFRALGTDLLNGVFVALRDLVHASRERRCTDPATELAAVAGVLTSMLAHVAAHRPGLEAWGAHPDDLRAAMAAIIDRSVGPNRTSHSNY